MKTVILLGTAHRVQGAERGICNIEDPDYETLVAQLCREYAVDFIFEEASGLGPTIAVLPTGNALPEGKLDHKRIQVSSRPAKTCSSLALKLEAECVGAPPEG